MPVDTDDNTVHPRELPEWQERQALAAEGHGPFRHDQPSDACYATPCAKCARWAELDEKLRRIGDPAFLRGVIADLEMRLAAETGVGEVRGWKFNPYSQSNVQSNVDPTWIMDAPPVDAVCVWRERNDWAWSVDIHLDRLRMTGRARTAWDAMTAARAAHAMRRP